MAADWAAGGDVQGANTRDQIIPCVESAHLCCKMGKDGPRHISLPAEPAWHCPHNHSTSFEMATKSSTLNLFRLSPPSLSVKCLPHFHLILVLAQIAVVPFQVVS
jgi:hypothetical protein